jgi:hypothetical protein
MGHVVSKKANRRHEDAKVNGKGKTPGDAPVTWPRHRRQSGEASSSRLAPRRASPLPALHYSSV